MNKTEENILIIDEHGCAVKIVNDELFYSPLLIDNSYEKEFNLVTEPVSQDFLDSVNSEFWTEFEMHHFENL